MGGSDTIGVLLKDGSVVYYVEFGGWIGCFDVFNSTIEEHKEKCEYSCRTQEDYFKDELFEEEDSGTRYLIINENEIVFRKYGDDEEFRLTRTKLKKDNGAC